MLRLETIESTTFDLLKRMQALPVLSETRLVGGTALAQYVLFRRCRDDANASDADSVRLGGGERPHSRRRARACHVIVGVVRYGGAIMPNPNGCDFNSLKNR